MRTRTCCALVLLIAGAVAVQAEEWNKSYKVSGKPEVRVQSDDGSIRVVAGSAGEVRATVSTCGWKISPDEVKIEEQQKENRIEITVRVPSGPHILVFGCRSVRVELTVPTQADLDLHSKDGRISVDGVKGNENLSSGDGRIEALGMDGALRADTGDGRVTVDGRFDVLNLHTGDGHIDAAARPGSKMAGSWSLRTSDGSVSLRLPEDIAADLDAHTGDGRITSDFPVTVSGSSATDSHSVRGHLNGGGPVLEIRTGDGGIRVTRY